MEIQQKVNFYYGIIMAMLAFVIIAGGLILVFVRYQKRLLLKQQQLYKMDAQYKQDLLRNSIESAEAERMRIARDVHDEIGSIFSTLALSVNRLNQENLLHPEHFSTSKSLIQSGIDSVRRISRAIVPFELELLGLQQTLENHFETVKKLAALQVDFTNSFHLARLTPFAAMALYRIVQELSSNCIKYAGATLMQLTIGADDNDNELQITYRDNGKGTHLGQSGAGKGIGMKNIESRVILLGGQVGFQSAPGEGFGCEIIFPLDKNTVA
ncbi:MAG: sensor histidine kinase [Ferruginibacter sp.]